MYQNFNLKITIFTVVKNHSILHRHVRVTSFYCQFRYMQKVFHPDWYPVLPLFMPPTLKKLMGHIAFGAWVRAPTVTFKPLKLEF